MSTIQVKNLTFGYDGMLEKLFENASFNIDTDWKLGLIGRNGKGKTTFLNILQGKLEYTGTITKSVELDYFPIEVKDENKMAIEIVQDIAINAQDWEIIKEINLLNTNPEILYREYKLLSGGEKTLTAISLLFSVMNLKRVPFVILDEVESALDEANVDRFGKYLNNYKGKTQLLIITHKKKTMEFVDLLYGITMEESGVSKLVSVRFEK